MSKFTCWFLGSLTGALLSAALGVAMTRAAFRDYEDRAVHAANAAWGHRYLAELEARTAAEKSARDLSLRVIDLELEKIGLRTEVSRLAGENLYLKQDEDEARRRQLRRDVPPGDLIPAQAVPEK